MIRGLSLLLVVVGFGCADAVEEPTIETAVQDSSPEPTDTDDSRQATLSKLGFGDALIKLHGTAPKAGTGKRYVGDCAKTPPNDDFDVVSFSAPWKQVGKGSSGSIIYLSGSRMLDFEKSKGIARKRFSIRVKNERLDEAAAHYESEYPSIAEITFGVNSVKIIHVAQTQDLLIGYHGFFPIVEFSGMPKDPKHTDRIIAHMHFGPLGPHDFDGWSENEIVELFDSVSAEKCLTQSFGTLFGAFNPTIEVL